MASSSVWHHQVYVISRAPNTGISPGMQTMTIVTTDVVQYNCCNCQFISGIMGDNKRIIGS